MYCLSYEAVLNVGLCVYVCVYVCIFLNVLYTRVVCNRLHVCCQVYDIWL